ncbi:class C sortase [Enterococcus sp. CSURQ0835]|uniref:class C sortase n=1 Tax=Enterococcus sp. CSURQ0835 TaxID=2681394 RepID=UPI00135CBF85|nr:class C sortase [Enterococcus sp. CSURQ0835]
MQTKPTRDDKINLGLRLLMALLFMMGFLIFMYPFVVDSINNFIDQYRLAQVQQAMDKNHHEQAKKRVAQLKKENEKNKTQIPGVGQFDDPFDETQHKMQSPQKEYFLDRTIGALFIPKINVSLPVFDRTSDVLLDKGATVLQGTSYPVGGRDTHAVITGHTGLPDKKLFTDLDQLGMRDQFFLHIGDQKLAYAVDQIRVVKPDDLESLKIQAGRDIVTLLTCTPYGINSHRLLVTGKRIPYPKSATKKIEQTKNYHLYRLVGLLIGCGVFLLLFFYFVWRKIILYQSRKRNFDLVFYLQKAGKPQAGVTFDLMMRRGKQPVKVADQIVQAVSDANGKVELKQLPGDIYYLNSKFDLPQIKAKVWRLKDRQFKVIARRKFLRKAKSAHKKRYFIEL